MKLELKHLAPYLPYGLKLSYGCIIGVENDCIDTLWVDNISHPFKGYGTFVVKPILRPLSDLKKDDLEFLANILQVTIATVKSFTNKGLRNNFNNVSYRRFTILLEHHFDVFGLIDKGLAIDINTLNK